MEHSGLARLMKHFQSEHVKARFLVREGPGKFYISSPTISEKLGTVANCKNERRANKWILV